MSLQGILPANGILILFENVALRNRRMFFQRLNQNACIAKVAASHPRIQQRRNVSYRVSHDGLGTDDYPSCPCRYKKASTSAAVG